jgi:RNA polymerase sigma factor (sigma-70 family)
MDQEPAVPDLVQAALHGDESAWSAIVDRYTPLLVAVLRGYRLRDDDARDVAQTVWLRLVEHLGGLREPRALPMWIIRTARNESLRVLKSNSRSDPFSVAFPDEVPQRADEGEIDDDLLRLEQRAALVEAFAELSDRDRALLALLVADPPVPYSEISRRLGIPIGSIGPTRARILGRLRASPAVAALGFSSGSTDGGGGRRGPTTVGRR